MARQSKPPTPPHGHAATGPAGEPRRDEPFDRAEALSRVNGSIELLRELVAIFVTAECPRLMDQLRDALDRGDIPLVRRAAHTLKGAVGVFACPAAHQHAEALETMAGAGKLSDDAEEIYEALDRDLKRLRAALEAFVAARA